MFFEKDMRLQHTYQGKKNADCKGLGILPVEKSTGATSMRALRGMRNAGSHRGDGGKRKSRLCPGIGKDNIRTQGNVE